MGWLEDQLRMAPAEVQALVEAARNAKKDVPLLQVPSGEGGWLGSWMKANPAKPLLDAAGQAPGAGGNGPQQPGPAGGGRKSRYGRPAPGSIVRQPSPVNTRRGIAVEYQDGEPTAFVKPGFARGVSLGNGWGLQVGPDGRIVGFVPPDVEEARRRTGGTPFPG